MKYTLVRQRDNGAWVVPTDLHRHQTREALLPMLEFVERGARNDAAGIANVVREGDTLTYERTRNFPGNACLRPQRPCRMTWRILDEAAIQGAEAAGVRIEYRQDGER